MTDNAEARPNRRMVARFIEAQGRDAPLMFWALVVGAAAGLVGASFRASVTGMDNLRGHFDSGDLGFGAPSPWQAALLSALAVMGAVWLVRRFAPEAGGSGVQEVEGALDGLRPMRWQRILPVKFVAGLLSLGSGLLMGREGPTIQMGAALGRMLSETFGLRPEHAHVLLAAGGGAGLTAAFNAPLAGMLFVIEEMRPQFHYNALSVQAVLIACATSDIVVRGVLGGTLILPMPDLEAPPLEALWIFPLFGALLGLIGYAFNGLLLGAVDRMARTSELQRLLLAGSVGGIIGWLSMTLPNAVGGGEALIERALTGGIPTLFLLALFLGRFVLTVASYGTGAPGGIFAPMLALGTLFGLWFGQISHGWIPALLDHPEVYTVAAMGALFSATVRAPITGIILAMELTGGYALLLPIVLTCIPATLVAHSLGGMPIYTLLLDRVLRDEKTETAGRLILYDTSPGEAGGGGQETVARLAERLNLEWVRLDIQGDPELEARYGSRLPVVEFDGVEICSGELSERGLEEGIKRVAAGTGAKESIAPRSA